MIQKLVFSAILMATLPLWAQNSCGSLFEKSIAAYHFKNNHNPPLRGKMIMMSEFETTLRDFSQALRDDPSVRTKKNLDVVIEVVKKYQLLLQELIANSTTTLMTPRIEMVELGKQEQFIANYKRAFENYAALINQLSKVLNKFKDQTPAEWSYDEINEILMTMHTEMGKAHNRF